MARRKSSKKRTKGTLSSVVTYVFWGVGLALAVAALFGTGYYLGYQKGSTETAQAYAKVHHELENRIKALQSERPQIRQQPARVQTKKTPTTYAAHEYNGGKKPPQGPKREFVTTPLPKLAIIIDDVAFAHDVRKIKQTGLPLTMSFLPPSERHPDSARLAAREPFYMVHLPLEAMNFSAEEPFTLRVDDSADEIAARITKLQELFPHARYINNHTGSAFTADERAVNRLLYTLNQRGVRFIDSRTTAQTKVPMVVENMGMPYIARDVFLDHDPDKAEIRKQIKRAVKIAKEHGSAIAIGHPHGLTLETLSESKDLFDGVKLVFINEMLPQL